MTGYRECTQILRDTDGFCSDWRRLGEETPTAMLSIQALDPPEHTHIRRLLLEAFRAVDVGLLEQVIAERAAGLLGDRDGLLHRESFDFISEFAEPLALRAVTHLLGVSEPDLTWFIPVSHAVVDAMDASLRPECYEPGVRARAELAALAGTWLAEPPAPGLVERLAGSEARQSLDRDIVLNSLRTVLHAGFESGSRFLGLALLALLRTPEPVGQIAVTPAAASELARYAGPVQADSRGCVRPTTLRGCAIEQGQVITLLIGAANRDPRAFDEPDQLRLKRVPNHHLGFGRGAHSCLGATIALQLARTAFTVLRQSCPGLTLAAEPVARPNATLRGLQHLELSPRAGCGIQREVKRMRYVH